MAAGTNANLQRLIDEIRAGQGIAENPLGLGGEFLGRVPESPTGTQDLLDVLRRNMTGAGKQTQAEETGMRLLERLTNQNMSPESRALLERELNFSNTAGQVSPTLANIQALLRSEYDRSREVSPEAQDVLARRQAALPGLTSPENTALWESMTRDLNKEFGGGVRAISGAQAARGQQGPTTTNAYRSLINDFSTQKSNAAQDLLVKNVDIKNRALSDLEGLVNYLDQAKFGRAQQTLGSYGDFSRYLDDEMFNRELNAMNLYGTNLQNMEQNLFNRQLGSATAFTGAAQQRAQNRQQNILNQTQNYQNELFRYNSDNLNRRLINMNNLAQEISARTGVSLGVPQYLEAQRTNAQMIDLQKAQIEALAAAGEEEGSGFPDPDFGGTDGAPSPTSPSSTSPTSGPSLGGSWTGR